jgi:hypothetical protein
MTSGTHREEESGYMAIIKVPKPPQSAMNKERPISSLLKTQLEHLQQAEFRLPARAQTNVYINAIKTEGQAADYIRQVTAALHAEHAGAEGRRAPKKKTSKASRKYAIAAMAKTQAGKNKKRRAARSRKKSTRS